jgi:hypothetical protein
MHRTQSGRSGPLLPRVRLGEPCPVTTAVAVRSGLERVGSRGASSHHRCHRSLHRFRNVSAPRAPELQHGTDMVGSLVMITGAGSGDSSDRPGRNSIESVFEIRTALLLSAKYVDRFSPGGHDSGWCPCSKPCRRVSCSCPASRLTVPRCFISAGRRPCPMLIETPRPANHPSVQGHKFPDLSLSGAETNQASQLSRCPDTTTSANRPSAYSRNV